jgi:predicted secreted protein
MSPGSALAVYFLVFVFTAFLMLPIGVRTDEEVGAPRVAGQAESAPHRFDLKRHLAWSALVSVGVFALFYANWVQGWVTADSFDFYHQDAPGTSD